MRELFFDCSHGISGDLTLGALIDLGVPVEALCEALTMLPLGGYRLTADAAEGHGLTGTKCTVALLPTHPDNRRERFYPELISMIGESALPKPVVETALSLLQIHGEATAAAHGVLIEEVCFHERGAVDTVIDLVGAAFCLFWLSPDRIVSTPLTDGVGTILCRRGVLPVPVPAVREITRRYQIPTKTSKQNSELVTPTGASIAAGCFGGYCETPPVAVRRGIGFGDRNRERGGYLICSLHEWDSEK